MLVLLFYTLLYLRNFKLQLFIRLCLVGRCLLIMSPKLLCIFLALLLMVCASAAICKLNSDWLAVMLADFRLVVWADFDTYYYYSRCQTLTRTRYFIVAVFMRVNMI